MNNDRNSLDIGTILVIIFIVLKLCNLINWSWLWVLSPLWIEIIIILIIEILF